MSIDVESLLDALDIRGRREGDKIWALCPNPIHQERTPSWFIRDRPGEPLNGAHVCFGCGLRGYPQHLVAAVYGVSLAEARRFLRDLPQRPQPLRVELEFRKPQGFGGMSMPPGVEIEPLIDWPDEPQRYLRERGVTDEQVLTWGIGYVPDGEENRLAGRVVVPVRDALGRLLSYTARDFTDRASKRYLEAPRSEGVSPSAVFGEEYWRRRGWAVVAEGAFNALACERAVGDLFAVAAVMGSFLHPAQAAKLARFELLVVATDADAAGERAADEFRRVLSRHVHRVFRAALPMGVDCDELPGDELRRIILATLQ